MKLGVIYVFGKRKTNISKFKSNLANGARLKIQLQITNLDFKKI